MHQHTQLLNLRCGVKSDRTPDVMSFRREVVSKIQYNVFSLNVSLENRVWFYSVFITLRNVNPSLAKQGVTEVEVTGSSVSDSIRLDKANIHAFNTFLSLIKKGEILSRAIKRKNAATADI